MRESGDRPARLDAPTGCRNTCTDRLFSWRKRGLTVRL